MLSEMKRLLVGKPLANEQLAHERLPKRTALAVFSSDALSSVAYATEAILIALLYANREALGLATPISIGIVVLLITVAFSYRQTIMAYPQGGGSYIVSRDNLGKVPSLVAASSFCLADLSLYYEHGGNDPDWVVQHCVWDGGYPTGTTHPTRRSGSCHYHFSDFAGVCSRLHRVDGHRGDQRWCTGLSETRVA